MEQSNLARIFKALSNEQRLKLFQMIHEEGDVPTGGGCCGLDRAFTRACDLLKISRSTVSHHIKELTAAGLITCERNGQSMICTVNPEAVKAVQEFLN